MRPFVLMAGARRGRRLLLWTACVSLAVLGLGAVEAHAATPSSLAGETLTSQNVKGSTLTGGCGETTNFSVSGTAAGPFPGTFTQSGSFTTLQDGAVTAFSSTFTINSTSGTVTGTRQIFTGDNLIECLKDFLDASNLPTVYTATINGSTVTTGTATFNISGVPIPGAAPDFSETFDSTGAVQKQCKHGGWRSFGTLFKNQGDCVAFFASGGKNLPSGKSSLGAAP